jgi:hypothetical protein
MNAIDTVRQALGVSSKEWRKPSWDMPAAFAESELGDYLGMARGLRWYAVKRFGSELCERPGLLDQRAILPDLPVIQITNDDGETAWRVFDVSAPGTYERLTNVAPRLPRQPDPLRPVDGLAHLSLLDRRPESIFAPVPSRRWPQPAVACRRPADHQACPRSHPRTCRDPRAARREGRDRPPVGRPCEPRRRVPGREAGLRRDRDDPRDGAAPPRLPPRRGRSNLPGVRPQDASRSDRPDARTDTGLCRVPRRCCMTRWRDPRLPPSYKHLAPSMAAHIPVNRAIHAVNRLLDSMDASTARWAEIDKRLAEAERKGMRR